MAWTSRSNLEMFEQPRVGANGHAVTLLLTDTPRQDDDEQGGLSELDMPTFR